MTHSREAPPDELLDRYLGIDLHDDALLGRALDRYRDRIEALRRIQRDRP